MSRVIGSANIDLPTLGIGGDSYASSGSAVSITNETQLTKKTPQAESYRVEKLNAVDEIRHPMPRLKHLKQIGKLLWSPDPTATNSAAVIDTPIDSVQMVRSDPLRFTFNGGSLYEGFAGLNIPIPSDGLMQFLMHIKVNGIGGFSILLMNESGATITFKYLNNWYVGGRQKAFQLWNPATDAHLVCASGNITITDPDDFFSGTTIGQVALRFDNPRLGDVVWIDGLYTQTKVTPMICDSVDLSSPNVFENLVPLYKQYNWSASLRWTDASGAGDDWNDGAFGSFNGYGLESSYRDGFDIYNGSLTRQSGVATTADTEKEVTQASEEIIKLGFDTPILYSSVANQLPPMAVFEPVANAAGIKFAKAPNKYTRLNSISPNGLDHPLYTAVEGARTYQQLEDQTKGLLYTGGFVMYFWHECPKFYTYDSAGMITGLGTEATARGLVAGQEYTTNSTASGGSVWHEAMVKICEFRKPFVDAGELLIVDASQLNAVLTGMDR